MTYASVLPHVLALLNVTTVVLLVSGFFFIRRRLRTSHKACMLGATVLAVAFLAVYLVYHFTVGFARFGGEGPIRIVYFAILIGHVTLAAVIVPMVPMTLARALGGRFEGHKRLARRPFPLSLFVVSPGVVVYVLSFHLFPISDV